MSGSQYGAYQAPYHVKNDETAERSSRILMPLSTLGNIVNPGGLSVTLMGTEVTWIAVCQGRQFAVYDGDSMKPLFASKLFDDAIRNVVISPASNMIMASTRSCVMLFSRGEYLSTLPVPQKDSSIPDGDILNLKISKNGYGMRMFVVRTDGICVYRYKKKTWSFHKALDLSLSNITGKPLKISDYNGAVNAVKTTSCGKLILGGDHGEIHIYDTEDSSYSLLYDIDSGCYEGRDSDAWRMNQGPITAIAWEEADEMLNKTNALAVGFASGRIVLFDMSDNDNPELITDLYHPPDMGGVGSLAFITVPALSDMALVVDYTVDLPGREEELHRLRPFLLSGSPTGSMCAWDLLPPGDDDDSSGSDGGETDAKAQILSRTPKFIVSDAHSNGIVPVPSIKSDQQLKKDIKSDPEHGLKAIVKNYSLFRHSIPRGVINLISMPRSTLLLTSGDDNSLVLWAFDDNKGPGGPRVYRKRQGFHGTASSITTYNDEDTGTQLLVSAHSNLFPLTRQDLESDPDKYVNGSVVSSLGYQSTVQRHVVRPFSQKSKRNQSQHLNTIIDQKCCYARHWDWANVVSIHFNDPFAYLWSFKDQCISNRVIKLPYEQVARSFALTPKVSKQDGKRIQVYPTGASTPDATSVAIDKSGSFVYIGYRDGQLHQYTLQGGFHKKPLLSSEAHNKKVEFLHTEKIVLEGLMNLRKVYSINSNEKMISKNVNAIGDWKGFRTPSHRVKPSFTAFKGEVKFLNTTDNGLLIGASDEYIRVWKLENLNPGVYCDISITEVIKQSVAIMNRHKRRVPLTSDKKKANLRWLTDASTIVCVDHCSNSGTFLSLCLRVESKERSVTLLSVVDVGITEPFVARCFGEVGGIVRSLAGSPDGRWLACVSTSLPALPADAGDYYRGAQCWPPVEAQCPVSGYVCIFDKLSNICIDWMRTTKVSLGAAAWNSNMTYLYISQGPQENSIVSGLDSNKLDEQKYAEECILRYPVGAIQCYANKYIFDMGGTAGKEGVSEVPIPINIDSDMTHDDHAKLEPFIIHDDENDGVLESTTGDNLAGDNYGQYSLSVKKPYNEILSMIHREKLELNKNVDKESYLQQFELSGESFFLGSIGSDAFNPTFAGNAKEEKEKEEEEKRQQSTGDDSDREMLDDSDINEDIYDSDDLIPLRVVLKPIIILMRSTKDTKTFYSNINKENIDHFNAKVKNVIDYLSTLSPGQISVNIGGLGPDNGGTTEELIALAIVIEYLIKRKRDSDFVQGILQLYNQFHILTINKELKQSSKLTPYHRDLLIKTLETIVYLTRSHWQTIDESLSRMECYLKLIPRLQMD